jgi:hypothetical protein
MDMMILAIGSRDWHRDNYVYVECKDDKVARMGKSHDLKITV